MRRRNLILILFLVPLGIGAAVCGWRLMTARPMFTDSSKIAAVKRGGDFFIVVPSNPTTGFSWEISGDPSPELVRFVDSLYKPDSNRRGLVGSGGREWYRFHALHKGETEVSLSYRRPWEKDIPAAKRETFKIHVD